MSEIGLWFLLEKFRCNRNVSVLKYGNGGPPMNKVGISECTPVVHVQIQYEIFICVEDGISDPNLEAGKAERISVIL